MSILRPISIFLRNFLIKQHPYFSCCASCGEIKTPLNGRLCTSLSPDFPIDLVLLGRLENNDDEFPLIFKKTKTLSPWIKQIFIITEEGISYISSTSVGDIKTINATELRNNITLQPSSCEASRLPLEALLHELPHLSGHFFVVHPERDLNTPFHALDLFTPNGIPIIFLKQTEDVEALRQVDSVFTALQPVPGIYAHTKKNSEHFLPIFEGLCMKQMEAVHTEPFNSSDYYLHLANWSYVEGLAISQVR